MAAAVHITRDPLAPAAPGRRCASWIYSYSVDGGTPIEYGTHLASLRGMLRRKHPQAKVTTAWAGNA